MRSPYKKSIRRQINLPTEQMEMAMRKENAEAARSKMKRIVLQKNVGVMLMGNMKKDAWKNNEVKEDADEGKKMPLRE